MYKYAILLFALAGCNQNNEYNVVFKKLEGSDSYCKSSIGPNMESGTIVINDNLINVNMPTYNNIGFSFEKLEEIFVTITQYGKDMFAMFIVIGETDINGMLTFAPNGVKNGSSVSAKCFVDYLFKGSL